MAASSIPQLRILSAVMDSTPMDSSLVQEVFITSLSPTHTGRQTAGEVWEEKIVTKEKQKLQYPMICYHTMYK